MRKFFCLFIVITTTYCNYTQSQTFNVPVKHTTPYGSFSMYQRVGIPMHYGNNGIVNLKHHFIIVLLNDSIIQKKVKIDISDSVHQLRWKEKDNKVVILPKDTKEIFRIDEMGKKITGMPRDSCWIFLVDIKKIRTYSITSEISDPVIAYIQKDEQSSILPLTKENLENMVQDNEEALALAKKGKLLKALRKYNQ